ncbi:TonB-dependent receptor [Ravibacter arvi]|uniref:TonB-dependent receptor n=1 Tax=Ravibacter arvi TaxID=2051041 RepID=A0ABP8LQX0_9BACT
MRQLFYTSCLLVLPVWLLAGITTGYCQQAIVLAQQKAPVAAQHSEKGMVLLRDALKLFENHFGVDIVFGDRIVQEFSVPSDQLLLKGMPEENLHRILESTGLKYKKIGGSTYAILAGSSRRRQARERVKAVQDPASPEPERGISAPSAKNVTPPLAERKISGRVTDEKNEAMPGVSILVKGTQRGMITDTEGRFAIEVPDGDATLVFSFVGYLSQEIPAGNRSAIDVTMQVDEKGLEELIVMGYGTQRKMNLTGAVSTIDSKVIENRPVSNLATAMQGMASGLIVTRTSGQPGSEGITMQIRGASSANGNVNPLVMLDGIAVPIATLESMNPNDVESISVLKDAAAAAIYGAQASGGVILITTKRGKGGKAVFDYSLLAGTSWMLDVPQRNDLLDEAQYANLSARNAGLSPPWSDAQMEMIRQGIQYYVNPADTSRYIYLNNSSFVDQTIRKHTPRSQHNISVRGGTDKLNYLVSLGLMNQQGAYTLGPDRLVRYNGRLNLGAQLTRHVSIDARIGYAQQDQEAPSRNASTIMGQTLRYRGQWPILTPEGRLSGEGGGSANMGYAYLKEGGFDNSDKSDLNGVFTLKIENLVKGLQLRAIYGGQYNRVDRQLFNRKVTTWQRFAPIYYLNDPNSYEVTRGLVKTNNVQYLADYGFNLAEKNRFHLMAGYQFEEYRSSSVTTISRNLASNDLPALGLGDDATKANSQSTNTYASQSYFGRLNFSHADRYLFEATLRYDESSRLARGKRVKAFPSVSAGWNLNQEAWFPSGNVVSAAKIRASWGQLGSSLSSIIGSYDYLNMLTRNNNMVIGGIRGMYFYQNVVPSSNLAWETIETSNGGIDLGFFTNKLNISFDYYLKYNRNMLVPQQLPAVFGVATPKVNGGELKTWGWELDITHRNRIGRGLSYNLGVNLSDNNNKLVKYAGQRVVSAGLVNILEGYPLRSIWGYQTAGYFQEQREIADWAFQDQLTGVGDTRYIDRNQDKRINIGGGTPDDPGDLVYLGMDQPRYTFGITGGLSWKGIDFSFLFQGVGSRTFFPNDGFINPQDAAWNQPMAYQMDYWTPDNRNATFPRPYLGGSHNYRRADKWLVNGRYIRLKNIQIGYSLPEAWTRKLNISRVRVFGSGQDLFTWSGLGIYKGTFSPEFTNNTSFQYPMYANASVGLNVSF